MNSTSNSKQPKRFSKHNSNVSINSSLVPRTKLSNLSKNKLAC